MISIYKITKITDEVVEAFERLIPQLSPELDVPNRDWLEEILQSEGTGIFLASIDNKIVGALNTVIYKITTGKKAWIEDVIVDDEARGLGIAQKLLDAAIEQLTKEGIQKIDLTSSPVRIPAHNLYQKNGFEKRETYVFRRNIE